LRATDAPKRSPAAPPEAVSSACWNWPADNTEAPSDVRIAARSAAGAAASPAAEGVPAASRDEGAADLDHN
jgi:hypothetical protein